MTISGHSRRAADHSTRHRARHDRGEFYLRLLQAELARCGMKSDLDTHAIFPRLRVHSPSEFASAAEFENTIIASYFGPDLWYAWPWAEPIARVTEPRKVAGEIFDVLGDPQEAAEPGQGRMPAVTARWPRLGSRPHELAGALAALGVIAEVTGRSVCAWLPGRENIRVQVRLRWTVPSGKRLPQRVWSWQWNNSYGWRPRADTAGTAVGVGTLLERGGQH